MVLRIRTCDCVELVWGRGQIISVPNEGLLSTAGGSSYLQAPLAYDGGVEAIIFVSVRIKSCCYCASLVLVVETQKKKTRKLHNKLKRHYYLLSLFTFLIHNTLNVICKEPKTTQVICVFSMVVSWYEEDNQVLGCDTPSIEKSIYRRRPLRGLSVTLCIVQNKPSDFLILKC